MFKLIEKIAEQAIQNAIKEGQFDNLPGKGKPIVFEDDSMVPPELRMAHKVLKNAGCLPPDMQDEKDLQTAIDMLEAMDDEQERYRQIQKVNYLAQKINMRRRRPINFEKSELYYRKIVEKTTVVRRSRDTDPD